MYEPLLYMLTMNIIILLADNNCMYMYVKNKCTCMRACCMRMYAYACVYLCVYVRVCVCVHVLCVVGRGPTLSIA